MSTVPSATASSRDQIFAYDAEHIEVLENNRPWLTDPKHFRHVKISAVASMKMLKHAMSGVEQGRLENGISFEVMGLIVGKPEGDTLIVMDAYPLPVKGAENTVVADAPEVQEYMVSLSDALERARPERFCGWYHSHPFDVDGTSHCYLSATDVGTQFSWQNQLDPWVALVIDPLRSTAKQQPDIQAFRCYPIAYTPPARECPDGTEADEEAKQLRWGKVANRYYSLSVSHFMSQCGANLLSILSRDHQWIRMLGSSDIMESESRSQIPNRLSNIVKSLSTSEASLFMTRSLTSSAEEQRKSNGLELAAKQATALNTELAVGHQVMSVKDAIFNQSH